MPISDFAAAAAATSVAPATVAATTVAPPTVAAGASSKLGIGLTEPALTALAATKPTA